MRAAGCEMQAPREFGGEAILAVHTASYLEFLKTAYDRWKQAFGENRAGPYACAHASPTRYPARVPASIQAQLGYFLSGGSAPVDASTWAAAMCALDVADRVAGGLREGYRSAVRQGITPMPTLPAASLFPSEEDRAQLVWNRRREG